MPSHSISSSSSSVEEDSVDETSAAASPLSASPSADTDGETSFHLKNSIRLDLEMDPLHVDSALVTREELDDQDNEIWLVTAPASLEPQELLEQHLPLRFGSRFKSSLGVDYETLVHRSGGDGGDRPPLVLLAPDRRGRLGFSSRRCEGLVQIVADVAVPAVAADALLDQQKAPAAAAVHKRRHPIHGDDLERLLVKAEPVANDKSVGQSAKKKRKKKKSLAAEELVR